MIRLLPYGLAALAVAGAVWWVTDLRSDNAALRADKASLTASVAALEGERDQARAAYAEADAVSARSRARSAALQQRIETILTTNYGGCADAPIDPDLLDDIGGLRGPR